MFLLPIVVVRVAVVVGIVVAVSGGSGDWIPLGGSFGLLVLFSGAAWRLFGGALNTQKGLIKQLQRRLDLSEDKIDRHERSIAVLVTTLQENAIPVPDIWSK